MSWASLPAEGKLMDIQLAGDLNGIETAAQLRDRYDVPVVYLTGYAEEALLGQAKVTEPYGYLVKPIRESELRATIEMALYRNEMEKRLRENEERFRAITESTTDITVILDREGTCTYTSPSLERMLDYSPTEVLGQATDRFILPDDMPAFDATFAYALQQPGITIRGPDFRVVHRDGRWLYLEGTVTNLLDLPDVNGVVFSGRDVTERVRAEKALQESEERLRLALEAATDGLYDWNIQTGQAHFSPRYYTMLGYEPYEMPASYETWMNLLHPDDRGRALDTVNEHLERKRDSHEIEFRMRTKSGEWRWILSRGRTIEWDVSGKPVRMVGTHVDITERVQAEEALRESGEQFRVMFESAHDLLTVADESGKTMWANSAWRETLGYSPETQGDPIRKIHPGDRERVIEAWQAAQRGQDDLTNTEYRYRTANGEYVFLETTVRKASVAGKPVLFVAAHDITERLRAQEALREHLERLEEIVQERTRELEDAQEQLVRREKLAVLGQLAGGVGHELRNPLGVIANAVYYLKMVLPDADDTVREYLGIISSEVHSSERIVSDLLDFARVKSPDRQRAAVSELVDRVLAKLPPPEDVQVACESSADLPSVYVDPRQVEQVLTNLVTNAYQAMPKGGTLTLRVSAEGDKVALSVADTGCGIAEGNLDKLFEPLFTTKSQGIGLGLALSKNLVEANGGTIEAESDGVPGQGSTFTVWLPVALTRSMGSESSLQGREGKR
jgi:PAS domain S-box-containing protein